MQAPMATALALLKAAAAAAGASAPERASQPAAVGVMQSRDYSKLRYASKTWVHAAAQPNTGQPTSLLAALGQPRLPQLLHRARELSGELHQPAAAANAAIAPGS